MISISAMQDMMHYLSAPRPANLVELGSPCRVFPPPAPASLFGQTYNNFAWNLMAREAGLRVPTLQSNPVGQYALQDPITSFASHGQNRIVFVIENEVVSNKDIQEGLTQACLRLAERAGCEFCDDRGLQHLCL